LRRYTGDEGRKSSVDCSWSRDEMRKGRKNDTTRGEEGIKRGAQILQFLVVLLMIFNAMNSRMC